jgi:hypothetical protein
MRKNYVTLTLQILSLLVFPYKIIIVTLLTCAVVVAVTMLPEIDFFYLQHVAVARDGSPDNFEGVVKRTVPATQGVFRIISGPFFICFYSEFFNFLTTSA